MSKQWMPAKFTALVLLISPISIAHAQSALDSYLAEGLANNQALQARTLDARAALAELDRARAERKPVLKLEARYLLSEGGRSIDFPAGDLLNPVYATLNGLTANSSTPTRFPQLENQSFDLLREHEQDTRIKLSAPLFAPGLDAAIRAAAAQADSAEAEREVAARTLIRDIRQAYYGYGQAQAALGVLQASSTVLTENVRVNNALVDSGKATRDAPLRAQAELLAIEDRSSTVQNQLDAAARYLNFLVRRPLDTPVPAAAPEPLNSLATPTAKERPELRALSASVRAAQAATDAERARAKPTLAFGIDAGIQGVGLSTILLVDDDEPRILRRPVDASDRLVRHNAFERAGNGLQLERLDQHVERVVFRPVVDHQHLESRIMECQKRLDAFGNCRFFVERRGE